MREIEFCEHWCGDLTEEQKAVLEYKIKTGKFLGVARAVGGIGLMPAFEGYPNKAWHVIDKCGYGQLSSSEGRKLYYHHHLDRMPTQEDANSIQDVVWLRSDSDTLVRWYKEKPIDADYWRSIKD